MRTWHYLTESGITIIWAFIGALKKADERFIYYFISQDESGNVLLMNNWGMIKRPKWAVLCESYLQADRLKFITNRGNFSKKTLDMQDLINDGLKR